MLADLIVMAVFGGGLTAASVGFGWGRYRALRDADEVQRVWSAFAEERGLTFEPAYGPWYDRKMPRIQGRAEGVGFFIDPMLFNSAHLLTPAGHTRKGRLEPYTIASGSLARPAPGLIVVANRERSQHIERPLGFRDIDMSDDEFASTCVVWAENDMLARSVLDARARKALVRLGSRGFIMTVLDGAIWIRWPGFETDATVLDAAREAVVALGRPHFEDPFG